TARVACGGTQHVRANPIKAGRELITHGRGSKARWLPSRDIPAGSFRVDGGFPSCLPSPTPGQRAFLSSRPPRRLSLAFSVAFLRKTRCRGIITLRTPSNFAASSPGMPRPRRRRRLFAHPPPG
ncbi:unnamed protein product, partial [Ectocarpus fasciculatus]